jgi:hypothetical protein
MNKKLATLAALFSLEFLSLGLFTNGIFSWSYQYIPPLPKKASPTDVGIGKFAAQPTRDSLVLEGYRESTPQPAIFLAAKETGGISTRSFVAGRFFSRVTLTSKVPRYIAKSVLNL